MNFRELKKYYQDQTKKECIELLKSSSFSQIVLIRHGEPDVERKGLFTKDEATVYAERYNQAAIINYEKSPICTDALPPMDIYHSKLKRAEHTAQLVFSDPKFNLVASEQYQEFERGPIQLPLIKMPIRWWNILSRFLWFLNVGQKEVESYSKATDRVKEGAAFLESHAEQCQLAVLIAHGIFNKFLGIKLKKKGWEKVYSSGGGFLGTSIYARKKQIP